MYKKSVHCTYSVQGADNKLGQFLGQDIEATANHRNVLRHSLESYSSLVSRNVSKPSLDTKICRQSTKLLQLSKKLCAPGRNQQGIEKFLNVHRSLIYLLKKVLKLKPGCWVGRCLSCPKLTQKRSFGLTRTVDLSQSVTSAKTLRSEIIEAKWKKRKDGVILIMYFIQYIIVNYMIGAKINYFYL